jgi:hypothetical protein
MSNGRQNPPHRRVPDADIRLDLRNPQWYISHQLGSIQDTQQEVAHMRTDPLPYEVRELVVRTFQSLDVAVAGPFDLEETILIDDGRYAARSYKADDCLAMWLVEIGIVQFYDADGNMLCTVNISEEFEPHRVAA